MKTLCALFILAATAFPARAVLFRETADPAHNTTTSGDNSGWQYEGFYDNFLGVPIAPYFFVTAKHVNDGILYDFIFHGDVYHTVAFFNDPNSDLRIFQVDRAFPDYAPLSTGAADSGATATVIGRGTQRGSDVTVSGELKGWLWGTEDHVERWGRNVVSAIATPSGFWEFLICDFDAPGIADECHLSVGDSGGGLFVQEGGLWRLAGVHYSVDGPFRLTPSGSDFNAALFDAGGLYYWNGSSAVSTPEQETDIPSSFYSTRIGNAARLTWIQTITSGTTGIAPESYAAWLSLYFTPTQRTDSAVTGASADYDSDGISNLLEYAFNLDPNYSDRPAMTAGSGLRGLPLIKLETISSEQRLTVEFVRRVSTSGSDITYTPQFTTDLSGTWTTGGSETVTPINARWERVKVVDSVAATDGKRFARLLVTQTP